MYDTIIIGTGPAGYTAAIYAARRQMKTLVIGKEAGGQLVWASEIENYPGFKKIDNFELITKMQDQVKSLDVEIISAEVQKIDKKENIFTVHTASGTYEAGTVIIAMGLSPRRLEIKGEKEFNARGVSYCANCDGPFYKDKIVTVVGGGNAALDAAEVLSKIAKKVYLVHRSDQFKGFEVLLDEVKKKENIELILNSEVKEIAGSQKVEKIILCNNQSQESREVISDGVFIEIGRIASTDLVEDFVDRDEKNQILVDEKCKTKTPGIFACGDVTQVPFKQITIACGQATIAALAAYEYLQLKEGKQPKMIVDRSH